MANCNVNTLLSSGKDFQRLSSRHLQIVTAQLLCNISQGGSGGVLSGAGSPVGVVTPSGSAAVYFDTNTGAQYNWYSGSWH